MIVTEECSNVYSFFQGEEPAHGDQLLHNVAGGGRLPRRPRRHAILSRIRGHGPGERIVELKGKVVTLM